MKFNIYAVRIFSLNWTRSLAFYKDTIGLPVKFENADMGWAEFDLGGASLGLEQATPSDDDSEHLVGRFVGLSLQVDDIDAVYQQLTGAGVEFKGPPARQPWGGVLAHFIDPDDNVITLLGTA